MKLFFFVFMLPILFMSTKIKSQDQSTFAFGFHPMIGITYTNQSQTSNKIENLELLLNLQANTNYSGKNFNFDSDLFIQYGQLVAARQHPQKTQDNFILNLMPSIQLLNAPSVRLFWQTKIETQLKEGELGNQKTQFFDPGFLTHTLFMGDKNYLISQTADQNFVVVYGIGYSFQQTIKKKYQLTSENDQSSNTEYIDGPTIVANLTLSKNINENIKANVSFNSLWLAKKDFIKSASNSRFSSLLTAALELGVISIMYTNRILYDIDLSTKRMLDQSLILGFKFDL